MKKSGIPNGFTIVELLIVVALIAIMASFATPAWMHYAENSDLKTATRVIIADITQTRQRAIAENTSAYQMTFNYSNNSYSLSRSDTGATLWTKKLTDYGKKNVLWFSWIDEGNVLKFTRRGTMKDGYIWVRNSFYSYSLIYIRMIGRPYAYYYLEK